MAFYLENNFILIIITPLGQEYQDSNLIGNIKINKRIFHMDLQIKLFFITKFISSPNG